MKECFYSILGVNRSASDSEIRKAYRRVALEWHPDKVLLESVVSSSHLIGIYQNLDRAAVAESRFKLIQEAFEILSDPDERAFYDGHRSQILNPEVHHETGDDRSAEDPHVNLDPFFDPDCFDGFEDDEEGFFAVYRKAFHDIDTLDVNDCGRAPYPVFGDSRSDWDQTNKFYREWSNYSTGRTFIAYFFDGCNSQLGSDLQEGTSAGPALTGFLTLQSAGRNG